MALRWQLRLMEKSDLRGDKMDLPAECLRDIMADSGHKDSIESPLTFKLQAQGDYGTVYGGVREFTADPGTCLVSPWLYRSFNDMGEDENGLVVTVELHPLLKASYCVLKPLADIPGNLNLKALLESHLRQNFTVISKGTTIDVNVYGKGVLSYFVEQIKSSGKVEVPAAVVIDTEISVDFSSSGFTQLGMNAQESDTTTEIPVDLLLQSDGYVSLCDGHIYGRKLFKINLEKHENASLTFNCKSGNDDVVIYASLRVERPSDLDFQFSSTESLKAGNSLCVDLSDYPRETNWPGHPGYLYLCIVSYGNKNIGEKFLLEGSVKPEKLKEETTSVGNSLCPNCREIVSSQSLQLHMLRCERLQYYCETCSSVVLKQHQSSHWHCSDCKKCGNSLSEKTLHHDLLHKKRYCICGFYGYQNELKHHCNNDCPKRSIICRYCHLEVEAGEKSLQAKDLLLTGPSLTQHESDCGSRTIVCANCKKSVQIKDVSIHMKMHETEKKYKPLPFIVCANKLCSLPRDYKNDMDLCNRCFGPFWLSEIDPGNKKRIQRLVHAYFKQLSSGCGRDGCLNQFCSSGSYNSEGKDPNMIAFDALNIAKKSGYLEPMPFREYFLCVDARNAKIRRVAENQLQVLGNYALEFCIEALNKTKPELNDDTDDEDESKTFTDDGVSKVWLSAAANWLLKTFTQNRLRRNFLAIKVRSMNSDDAHKKDPKYRRYTQALEKLLQAFETISEWPDIIQFLSNLQRLLGQYSNYNTIPYATVLSKRLAQCLNPGLPSGVHSKSLEAYNSVFKNLSKQYQENITAEDLIVFGYGLFNVLEHLNMSVKPQFLALFDQVFSKVLSRDVTLFALPGLLNGILPGLDDETSEYFERSALIVNKIRNIVNDDSEYYSRGTFNAFIRSRNHRLGGLCLLNSLDKSKVKEIIKNKDQADLLISAFACGLADENILVQRGTLDLLVSMLPIQSENLKYIFTTSESSCDILMESALSVVLRKDMSLNRRLYTWLSGNDGFFTDYEWSVSVIKKMINFDFVRSVKIIISLMDKTEIGMPIAFECLSTVFHGMMITNDVQTGSMIIDIVDPLIVFGKIHAFLLEKDKQDLALYSVENCPLKDEDSLHIHYPALFISASNVLKEQLLSGIDKEHLPKLDAILKSLIKKIPESILDPTSKAEAASLNIEEIHEVYCGGIDIDSVYSSELYAKIEKHLRNEFINISFTTYECIITSLISEYEPKTVLPNLATKFEFIFNEYFLNLAEKACKNGISCLSPKLKTNLFMKCCYNNEFLDSLVVLLEKGLVSLGNNPDELKEERFRQIIIHLWGMLDDLRREEATSYIMRLHDLDGRAAVLVQEEVEKQLKRKQSYDKFSFFWRHINSLPTIKEKQYLNLSFSNCLFIMIDLLNSDNLDEKRIGGAFLKCSLKSLVKIVEPLLLLFIRPSVLTGLYVEISYISNSMYNVFQYGDDKLLRNLDSTRIDSNEVLFNVLQLVDDPLLTSCTTYLELITELLLKNLNTEISEFLHFLSIKLLEGGHEKRVQRIQDFTIDRLLMPCPPDLQSKLILVMHMTLKKHSSMKFEENNEVFDAKIAKLLINAVTKTEIRSLLPHYVEFISSCLDFIIRNHKIIAVPLIKILIEELDFVVASNKTPSMNDDVEIPLLLTCLEKLLSGLCSSPFYASAGSTSAGSTTPVRSLIGTDFVNLFSNSNSNTGQVPGVSELLVLLNTAVSELLLKCFQSGVHKISAYRVTKLVDFCMKQNPSNFLKTLISSCSAKDFSILCDMVKDYDSTLILKILLDNFDFGMTDFITFFLRNSQGSTTSQKLQYVFQHPAGPFNKDFLSHLLPAMSNEGVSKVLRLLKVCATFLSDSSLYSGDPLESLFMEYLAKCCNLVCAYVSKNFNTRNNRAVEEVLETIADQIIPNLSTSSKKNIVLSILSDITSYAISPLLKGKVLTKETVNILKALILSPMNSTSLKLWKKDLHDFFMEPKFFTVLSTPENVLDYSFILNSVLLLDSQNGGNDEAKWVEDILSNRVQTNFSMFSTATSSMNFISTSNKDHERALYLRKLSFLIFSGKKDHYAPVFNQIEDKLIEILKMPLLDSTLLEAEVFLAFRVVLLKFSGKYLFSMWPKLITEILRVFNNLLSLNTGGRIEYSFLCTLLNVCKLLDLIFLLDYPDFQSFAWMFDDGSGLFEKLTEKIKSMGDLEVDQDSEFIKAGNKKKLLIDSMHLNTQTVSNVSQLYGFFRQSSYLRGLNMKSACLEHYNSYFSQKNVLGSSSNILSIKEFTTKVLDGDSSSESFKQHLLPLDNSVDRDFLLQCILYDFIAELK